MTTKAVNFRCKTGAICYVFYGVYLHHFGPFDMARDGRVTGLR
jgi:hypothetical protein